MTDLRTVSPDELHELGEIPSGLKAIVFTPNGPLQAVSHERLLAKLIATDLCKETKAQLDADLSHDANSVSLVFGDPSATLNGWYRKVGASGAGGWQQFEELARSSRVLAQASAIAAAEDRSRASNTIPFVSWDALLTASGAMAGDRASVIAADTGTHIDPVAGETVPNAGIYVFSASPEGWRRVANLDSQDAAAQVAAVAAAGAVFTPLSKEARDGGALGKTAINANVILTRVASPGNTLGTSARWAKAFDVGAVNDDNTVVAGAIVSGIVIQGSVRNLASAATVRGRVWRRALTSAAINGAPGSAGDVLISDSGAVPPPSSWPNLSGLVGHATVILPVPEFETPAGFALIPDVEWRDAGGALLLAGMGYKQLGANLAHQRYAGFSYTSTGASSWTASSLQRPWALGLATRTLKSIAALETLASKGGSVPAAAENSLLTPMERLMIEEGGAWDKVKRPGVSTVNEGLARLFGDTAWTPGIGRGQYGVDFGPTTPLASLIDGTTIPGWQAGFKRILLNASTVVTTPDGLTLSGFKLDDGYVDIANTFPQALVLRNFDIRTIAASLLNGVQQGNGLLASILLENGHIQGQFNRNINISNGTIRRCSFDLTGADCIGGGGSIVTIEQCLARRPGHMLVGQPATHGDVLQFTGSTFASITGSTFYFPAMGSTYDEGVHPSTNVLRIESGGISNSTPGAKAANAIIAGNVLAGGGYTVGLAVEGAGQSIENYLFLGNRYAPLVDYTTFGHFIFYTPRAGDTTGFFRNVAIFDEYQSNGSPITVGIAGAGSAGSTYGGRTEASWKAIAGNPNPYRPYEERWGIFDFDRSKLDARTIEALKRYGKATGREILRWNNTLNPAYDLGSVRGV